MTDETLYLPTAIESRAQQRWEQAGCFQAQDGDERPKYYCLSMLPTLASQSTHMGYCRNYMICDVMARYQQMKGRSVLHPIGWNAFGSQILAAAQDAGTTPDEWTAQAAGERRALFKRLGLAFDWSREISTSASEHLRWQQWLFLQMWNREPSLVNPDKQTGVAYWDPGTKSYLTLRQLINGRGPESGMLAELRKVETYEIAISTEMNKDLVKGLEDLPRWDRFVRNMQRESIGLEEGLAISFAVRGKSGEQAGELEVFTSRPDTMMGATFVAVGVDHPLAVQAAAADPDVARFCEKVSSPEHAYEKIGYEKRQEGLPLGYYAVNPVSGDNIPIWVTNYAVTGYGTGASLGVPAHDQRDFNFAVRHNLPMRRVALDDKQSVNDPIVAPYVGRAGTVVNSGELAAVLNRGKESLLEQERSDDAGKGDSLDSRHRWAVAMSECVHSHLSELGARSRMVTVARLRSWKVSQQEYSGCPVPLVHCPACGVVPVPEDQLPVELPAYQEGCDTLADYPEFIACACPSCGGEARRDTDTFVKLFDTSWHHNRLADPAAEPGALDAATAGRLPVDFYCCGVEHATNQLLCARIMHRFLAELGVLPPSVGPEPFKSLLCQGLVLNYGLPMAPSYGNAIEPDRLVEETGTDLLRLYLVASVDPRHALHWDDSKLFGLQGLLDGGGFQKLLAGELDSADAERVRKLMSDEEIDQLRNGLLDQAEFQQLRAGKLTGPKMEQVRELLDDSELNRIQNGFLDDAGLRQLRKGTLEAHLLAKVGKTLKQEEIWRLQHGLLEKHEFRSLLKGQLPDKLMVKVRELLDDKTIAALQKLDVDIDAPGAVDAIQKKHLDRPEREMKDSQEGELAKMRAARQLLCDGEIKRLQSGLLDEQEYAALAAGTLEGDKYEQARRLLSDSEMKRIQSGLLSEAEFKRLRTGRLEGDKLDQARAILGDDGVRKLQAGELTSETERKLKRRMGDRRRFEQLRHGKLDDARLQQALEVIDKAALRRFQKTALDEATLDRLLGFIAHERMDLLVNFIDEDKRQKLEQELGADGMELLGSKELGRRPARPLLQFLDRGKMDLLLNYIDDAKMRKLVRFADGDKLEKLLGFNGRLWDLVLSKRPLIDSAAQAAADHVDQRRAELHRCLQVIDSCYVKDDDPAAKSSSRDLELHRIMNKVKEIMALLETAVAPDSEHDRAFATEACRILLQAAHPIIPHITEELWQQLGFAGLLAESTWPEADLAAIEHPQDTIYVVQENGKRSLTFAMHEDLDDDEARQQANIELQVAYRQRGYPSFPRTGEEIVHVETAHRGAMRVINFVTYQWR